MLMPDRLRVPNIFEGEVPEDFRRETIEKFDLAQRQRQETASFLGRMLGRKLLSKSEVLTDDHLTDLVVRSLYRQALAEKTEQEIRARGEIDKYDELTGLLTRRYFKEYGDEMLRRINGQRKNDPVGVVAAKIDLVEFKKLNDCKGYDAGDNLIVVGAGFLRTVIRDSDLLGRWGGDEYVILAPVQSGSSVEEVESHLKERLYDIPQDEHFAEQLRWDFAQGSRYVDTQKLIDSIDINTEKAKQNAQYSRKNELYSIS
jgi:diguanylate cyclase (GGDEF)-like protein